MEEAEAMLVEGPKPYSFEPKFTPEELQARRQERLRGDEYEAEGDDPPPPAPDPAGDRLANNDWCFCGVCTPMETPLQCRCCVEVINCLRFLSEDISCITAHDDFRKVCLERAVLRTSLIARLDTRGHRDRIPDQLDNESYRYAAYRMFTYWIYGLLGRGVRKVIPACAVALIRQTFPSANGHYVEFTYGARGEEMEVPEEFAI